MTKEEFRKLISEQGVAYIQQKEMQRRMINNLSDEAKKDLNVDDLIQMLTEKKKYKQHDLLKDSILDAKLLRQRALENARLRIEESFSTHMGKSGKSGFPGNIGVTGPSGQAGIMGTAGTSRTYYDVMKDVNAFHSINPFKNAMSMNDPNCIVDYTENMNDYDNSISFDNLNDSEFKESVKKLYEGYKI